MLQVHLSISLVSFKEIVLQIASLWKSIQLTWNRCIILTHQLCIVHQKIQSGQSCLRGSWSMPRSNPYVILSAAMSIDGKIATRTGRSRLSSDKDLTRIHKLRGAVDAILVGKNTVSVDDPSLTVRRVTGRNTTRII